jgi:D-alanyl-D-alanine carboxypeptidase
MRRRNRALFVVIIFLLFTLLFLGINLLHKVDDKSDISFEENDTDILRDEDEQIDWRLILVNASHKIPENYEITLLTLSNGRKIDERIYPDLQEMFDDARAEGVYPKVGEESNLVLVEGRKNGNVGLKILHPLIAHENNGEYSKEVKDMFSVRR